MTEVTSVRRRLINLTIRLANANLSHFILVFHRTRKQQHFCRMFTQRIPVLNLCLRKFKSILWCVYRRCPSGHNTRAIVFFKIGDGNAKSSSQLNFKELPFSLIIQLVIILCSFFQLILFTLCKAQNLIKYLIPVLNHHIAADADPAL